jgi:trehalose-phosphatase
VAQGGSLLVLTDYDGTLTPIVDDPGAAWLDAPMQEQLARLARSTRARVAVISGRDVDDLRARVAVPGVIYAGCHGLDIEGPGIRFRHPEAEAWQHIGQEVVRALKGWGGQVPGMHLEPKRLSFAVHYRHVPVEDLPRLELALARALRPGGSRLRVLRGIQVIEVLPQVKWTKGDCARLIRDRVLTALPGPVATLVLGDDWTDEDAFEALAGQGLTVRVGREVPATQAQYRLTGPAEVQSLLADVAAAIGTGDPA